MLANGSIATMSCDRVCANAAAPTKCHLSGTRCCSSRSMRANGTKESTHETPARIEKQSSLLKFLTATEIFGRLSCADVSIVSKGFEKPCFLFENKNEPSLPSLPPLAQSTGREVGLLS